MMKRTGMLARVWECGRCGDDILPHKKMYHFGIRWLCGRCLMEVVHGASVRELAEMLDCEVVRAETLIGEQMEEHKPCVSL